MSGFVLPSPVGVFLTSGGPGAAPRAELGAALVEIEQLGYLGIWFGEGAGREAFTAASVMLAATGRAVVGSAVATLWGRDAMAAAAAGRTLAEAYPGRFALGVGISHPHSVQRRGHEFGRPLDVVSEYLRGIAEAPWTGPPAARPPVLVGALGPRMLRLAGEQADGAVTFFVDPAHTRRARELLGPDALLVVEQAAEVTDSRRPPPATLRHAEMLVANPSYRRHLGRMGYPSETELLVPQLDRLVVWGSPRTIAARVRQHLDAGADQVAVWPLDETGDSFGRQTLRLLAPELRAIGGRGGTATTVGGGADAG